MDWGQTKVLYLTKYWIFSKFIKGVIQFKFITEEIGGGENHVQELDYGFGWTCSIDHMFHGKGVLKSVQNFLKLAILIFLGKLSCEQTKSNASKLMPIPSKFVLEL